MFTLILFGITLLLVLFHYFSHTNLRSKVKTIPGPREYPIIGNLLSLTGSNVDLFNILREYSNKYYPIFKITYLNYVAANIRHPDDVEILLSNKKNINKSEMYFCLHPWLGTGLLTSTSDKWYNRRKILTPTFHFNILQQFLVILNEKSELLVKSLQAENGVVVKDVFSFTKEYTLNTICETAMGISLENNSDSEYRRSVHSISLIIVYRMIRPWLWWKFLFLLHPLSWQQTKLLKVLHNFTKKIIEERKHFHNESGNRYLKNFETPNDETVTCVDKDNKIKTRKRLAMLDLLIAASRNGNQIDDEGIREEVDTFMFEGHDTTASGLAFILLILAKHKDVQAQAREEVDSILLESNESFTMSTLQNLSYLERCIKEVLRLYPSVHLISREITEELKLKNHVIPAGCYCHIHIYDIHRDPNFWPNPNTFDPDRFLPENIEDRHPFSYIPFSAGPRNCIGQKFAMMELKCCTAFILRHFYLEPVEELDDVQILPGLILQPTKPIHIKFIPRK